MVDVKQFHRQFFNFTPFSSITTVKQYIFLTKRLDTALKIY